MAFKLFLHHIDVVNNEYIAGWVINRFIPNHSTTLYFYLNGKRIGQVKCDQFRQDVEKTKMHKTGLCGFEYQFPTPLDIQSADQLELRIIRGLTLLRTIQINRIQKVIDTGRSIVFMHIPKTAGTSFNNQARLWFGQQQWHTHIEALDKNQQQALLKNYRDISKYLAGHLTLENIRSIVGELDSIDLHTIIRNPFDHIHSHLAWIKGIKASQNQAFISEHHLVVRQLSETLQQVDLSDPIAIRQFAGHLDGFQIDFFDNLQTRYFLDYRPDKVSENDLTNAIKNIPLFNTIGITEQYNDYLKQWPAYYDRDYQPQNTQHNPSTVSKLFNTDQIDIQEALLPLVQYDNMLYQHIQRRAVKAYAHATTPNDDLSHA